MKNIKAYQCETCQGIYESEEKASMCEANHASNIKVVHAWFEPGKDNPHQIQIAWTDAKGNERGGVWYK